MILHFEIPLLQLAINGYSIMFRPIIFPIGGKQKEKESTRRTPYNSAVGSVHT